MILISSSKYGNLFNQEMNKHSKDYKQKIRIMKDAFQKVIYNADKTEILDAISEVEDEYFTQLKQITKLKQKEQLNNNSYYKTKTITTEDDLSNVTNFNSLICISKKLNLEKILKEYKTQPNESEKYLSKKQTRFNKIQKSFRY